MEREQNTTAISDIISEGTGTPYVAIFDAGSSAILDPSTNMPIGELVDNFVYEYTEEKEDSGSFVIISNGPSICDLPQLQHNEILWLQWGYLLPNHTVICGKPRQVMITDISVSFRNNGVSMEVKFADSSIKLKNIPANYFSKEVNFFQDLSSILKGYPITPVIKIYPKNPITPGMFYLLEKQPKKDYGTSVQGESGTVTVIESVGYVKDYNHLTGEPLSESWDHLQYQASKQPATEIAPDLDPVKVIKVLNYEEALSEYYQSLIHNHPDQYKLINANAVARDYRGIPTEENPLVGRMADTIVVTGSAPKNAWGQIYNLTNLLPDGPFYMDGRDGSLVIHNGMHTRPVFLKYTYLGGKGELLDFQINSKFIRSAVEVVSGADIDPDSKDLVSTVVQGIHDKSMANPDVLYMDWKSNPEATDPSHKSSSNSQGEYDIYHNLSGADNNWTPIKDGTGNLYTDGYRKGYLRMLPKTYASDPMVHLKKGQITEEERDRWLKETFQEWDRAVNSGSISTQQELTDYIHKGFYLKPLKVKRVRIIDILAYDPAQEPNRQHLKDFKNFKDYYSQNTIDKRISDLLGDNVEILSINKIFTLISEKFPDYWTPLDSLGTSQHTTAAVYRVVYQEEESLDGIRVLDDITDFTSILQTNDVQENLSNQIQATATVLGRPSLESSMNIEVNNVAKFSGIWYTKKVIHRINTSNGYTSEIEFVQRSSNVVETVISKRQALSDISQQLNKDVAKSIEAGTWKHTQPEFIEKVISSLEHPKTWKGQPWSNLLVSINPEGYTVVSSDKDVVFNTGEAIDHQEIAKNL